jgi:hypothetical protein
MAYAGNSLFGCFQMNPCQRIKGTDAHQGSGLWQASPASVARKLTAMEWLKGVSARWWGKRQSQKPIVGTRKRSAG